jgi:hypothetical protein
MVPFQRKKCAEYSIHCTVHLFMRNNSIMVRPGIRNLLNSTVGHLRTASAKWLTTCALKTPASAFAPLHLIPNPRGDAPM